MYHFTINKDGLRSNPSFECHQGSDSKVCIISLIGKSRLDRFRMKSGIFNSFIRTDVFSADGVDSKCNCYVEGYFHKADNVLLLHLVSRSDSTFRMELYRRWLKEDSTKDHSEYLREANHDYMRALLFIFSVSHVVLVNEPGSSFDISYIRLFKQLDLLRGKLQPLMTDLLASEVPDLSKIWIEQARLGAPRVLFLFETCLLSTDDGEFNEPEVISKAKSKKLNALRELQHAVEEMIFKVFKKERIIINNSTNTLLTLSPNHDFVYILSEEESSNILFDPTVYYGGLISEACSWPETTEVLDSSMSNENAGKPSRYSSLQSAAAQRPSTPQQPPSLPSIDGDIPTLHSSKVRNEDEELRNFLRQHVDVVFKRGNADRTSTDSHFEPVPMKTFLKVVEVLHGLLWSTSPSDRDASLILQNFFEKHVDVELKFSETQCTKVFVHAMSVYQKDLPDFYNKRRHLNMVNEAKQYFMLNSRGPSVQKYLKKLEKECLKIWKDNRRSCEKVSMKGHPCCNELHKSQENADDPTNLPLLEHRSNIVTRSTCNCGRSQDERVDPFSHKVANFDFFQEIEKRCCSKLEHHHFSIHIPSSIDSFQTCSSSTRHARTIPQVAGSLDSDSLRLTPSDASKDADKTHDDGRPKAPKTETSSSEDSRATKDGDRAVQSCDFLKYEKLSMPGVSSPDFGTEDSHDFDSRFHKFPVMGEDEEEYDEDSTPYERNAKDDDDDDRDYKLSQGNDDDDSSHRYTRYGQIRAGGDYFKEEDDDNNEEDDCGDDDDDDGVDGGADDGGGIAREQNGDGDAVRGHRGNHGDSNHGNDGRVRPLDDDITNTIDQEDDYEEGEEEPESNEEEDEEDDETRDDTSVDVTAATDRTSDDASEKGEETFGEEDFELAEDSEEVRSAPTTSDNETRLGYLLGMVNSESPRGLLPLFSSWSLVRLGKYASYEASVGIDQLGFTHQSNFLLPIDIKLQHDPHDSWSSKPFKGRVLRLYVGLEYECSKAHRFLLCSPNKMLKVTPGAHMKETGSRVVSNDMPLYFPCSCRSNASQMGQLMRIHVAVPDCDLEVKLKIRVQPGPPPCPIFFPEGGESITLRTGLWVLRLPYVYFDGSKTYLMPNDQKASSCKLLKGCLTVLERRTTQREG